EQEARTDLLRKKAQIRSGRDGEEHEEEAPGDTIAEDILRHVDIFATADDNKDMKNVEHEKELKEEKEKYEKNIGYLTYLGQSELDTGTSKPWYLKSHEERILAKIEDVQKKPAEKVAAKLIEDKDRQLKDYHDPLRDMEKCLEVMRK